MERMVSADRRLFHHRRSMGRLMACGRAGTRRAGGEGWGPAPGGGEAGAGWEVGRGGKGRDVH
jgi:hypothetical protein